MDRTGFPTYKLKKYVPGQSYVPETPTDGPDPVLFCSSIDLKPNKYIQDFDFAVGTEIVDCIANRVFNPTSIYILTHGPKPDNYAFQRWNFATLRRTESVPIGYLFLKAVPWTFLSPNGAMVAVSEALSSESDFYFVYVKPPPNYV